MRDLLGADIEDHIAVFRGRSAVPALEEIGHHDTDLAPLAAQHLLELLGIDGVGALGLGVVLAPFVQTSDKMPEPLRRDLQGTWWLVRRRGRGLLVSCSTGGARLVGIADER